MELDPRIVRVGIEVNGRVKYYEGLDIHAQGMKYANPNQNECEVRLTNMDKVTRDYILTETSPFNINRTPKKLIVEAGRQSYGTTVIFMGDITASGISQPPDIGVTLKAMTGNFKKGDVISRNKGSSCGLKTICQGVAGDIGATLDFQATDKSVANYSYSGGALKQMDVLQESGDYDVYLDNNVLIVKDRHIPLNNRTRILNLDTGMIGIPELTEQGLKVRFLLDNQTAIGGALEVTSKIYPAINGKYAIYKLGFSIASRDVPFYYEAECKRISA